MIRESAFCGCSSKKEIEIPSLITKIQSYTFYKCSSLKKIKIPSSVTTIKNYAFEGCSSLEQFEFPPLIKSIERNTFFGGERPKSLFHFTKKVVITNQIMHYLKSTLKICWSI